MFDLFLKLLQMVISKLPGVDFSTGRLRKFARSLLVLHKNLLAVVDNGELIVSILECHARGERIDNNKLVDLISEQELLVDDILQFLEDNQYEMILKVKLPILFPVQVFHEKKCRLLTIHVWIQLLFSPGPFEKNPSQWLKLCFEKYGFPLKPTSEWALNYSRKNLEEIRSRCQNLRNFLDSSFDIEQLL